VIGLLIVAVMIIVIIFILKPRDAQTIVIASGGEQADFNVTSALEFANRVSHIAEVTVGAVLTLALGLIGFSWLSNNARAERDREELAEHKLSLQAQFDEEMNSNRDVIESIEEDLSAVREKLDAYILEQPEKMRFEIKSVVQELLPRAYAGPNEVIKRMSFARRFLRTLPDDEPGVWISSFSELFGQMFKENIHRSATWKNIKDSVLDGATDSAKAVQKLVSDDPERVNILNVLELVTINGFLKSLPGDRHIVEEIVDQITTVLSNHHLQDLHKEIRDEFLKDLRGDFQKDFPGSQDLDDLIKRVYG
jgi:preprotein translocase subunit SecG